MYRVTKKFGGYSCCFRQHKSKTRCRFLHGYSLFFIATFEGGLDANSWVIDFGSFGLVKQKLKEAFDHKMVISKNDPLFDYFLELEKLGGLKMKVLNEVSIEIFAKYAHDIIKEQLSPDIELVSVQCLETENNTAIFFTEPKKAI